jgi:hypothetical protein
MNCRLAAGLAAFVCCGGMGRAEEITYTKHVAPILFRHCVECHRPGEIGPFSLLTYQDAAKRADFLRDITASRRMPPWKPEPHFGEFRGERRLAEQELEILRLWVEQDTPEGDPRDLPEQPKFPQGWQLGEPDMVLTMSEPFEIPGDGPDLYKCFVVPIPTTSDRTIAAVEIRPGNSKVVHHIILYLDRNGRARRRDDAEPGPGYSPSGNATPGVVTSGGLGGWAPGLTPSRLPDGVGLFLRQGSDLIIQVHYHPTGKPEVDQSRIGLHFTPQAAPNVVFGVALHTGEFVIPAGASHFRISTQLTLPMDAQALSISPHMHSLGREMKVTSVLPDGTRLPLIWLKDWDFNWQQPYWFAEPVRLPKGTRLEMDAYYDNSAANPQNPNSPPRPVKSGESTADEMCLCGLQIIADDPREWPLALKLPHRWLAEGIGGPLPIELSPFNQRLQLINRKLRSRKFRLLAAVSLLLLAGAIRVYYPRFAARQRRVLSS